MKKESSTRIQGQDFSVDFDECGGIREMRYRGDPVKLLDQYPLYEIDDAIAETQPGKTAEGSVSFKATTTEASGKITVSGNGGIRFHWSPDKGRSAAEISMVLGFPLQTRFHIPEGYNVGRTIDSDMPVGEWYSPASYPISRYAYIQKQRELYKNGLGYGFFLAEVDSVWLRLMIRENEKKPDVHISRHAEAFAVTFRWPAETDAYLRLFPSMDAAVEDFRLWMEKEFGIKSLKDEPNVPPWVHDVRLVFIVDMLRGNWEITHDYDDVARMVGDLKRIGCPKETLFYLPGWNGAYDSTYPKYEAHPDLGGEGKLRRMMDALHENGFRAMIHTNAWGLDPCHADIDRLIKYVKRDEEGSYDGWQCSIPKLKINRRVLKFRTSKIAVNGPKGATSMSFKSVPVPEECEAFITLGNLKAADARIKMTVDRRSVLSPPGWFKSHSDYAYPFPVLLKPGANEIRLEALGETGVDWSDAWYRIRWCFIPPTPYTSWTYPILHADTADPEWIEIFVDNVAGAVKKYGFDAVHVDASGYEKHPKILDSLKARLPGVAIAGEGYGSMKALGFWAFSQVAKQSLIGYLEELHGTRQQASLPDRGKIGELYQWLNKTSPVANFVGDYIRLYPHLCAADAFVPVGKVCTTFPARLSPRNPEELWEVLRDARRLNYIPGLRLNYRKYGLDPDTEKAVREIAAGS